MFAKLKQHPFPVQAYFDYSLVLTYAFDPAVLRPLAPDILELDTFEDRWASAAVAMVQTRGLRPLGFPSVFGSDFFLIGYRIFVRYRSASGQGLRGLYILRSETDTLRMRLLGNRFTSYRYNGGVAGWNPSAHELPIPRRRQHCAIQLGKHTESSIRRARRAYPPDPATMAIDSERLPLEFGSVDLVALVFAAHEIRDEAERIRFFRQLAEALTGEGRILVVEHLRDWRNLAAFNFGFLHFQSDRTWCRTFSAADLQVESRQRPNFFVNAYLLKR